MFVTGMLGRPLRALLRMFAAGLVLLVATPSVKIGRVREVASVGVSGETDRSLSVGTALLEDDVAAGRLALVSLAVLVLISNVT